MRTCDNTQYTSIKDGNERDTHGLLYFVPFYHLETKALTGVISVIIRANILEAALLGLPALPLTDGEKAAAKQAGHPLPDAAANFMLSSTKYGITIFDRRNPELPAIISRTELKGSNLFDTRLSVHDDADWTLHYSSDEARRLATTSSPECQRHKITIRKISAMLPASSPPASNKSSSKLADTKCRGSRQEPGVPLVICNGARRQGRGIRSCINTLRIQSDHPLLCAWGSGIKSILSRPC